MNYKRSDRLASLIKEETSKILLTELRNPAFGFVTITRVRLSDDLRNAKIYYSVLGDDVKKQAAQEALEKTTGLIRSEIGQRIKIRHTPSIRFFFDDSTEYADHIESLIKKINAEH